MWDQFVDFEWEFVPGVKINSWLEDDIVFEKEHIYMNFESEITGADKKAFKR